MGPSNFPEQWVRTFRQMSRIPLLVFAAGCVLLLLAASQTLVTLFAGGVLVEALLYLIFVGVPGAALMSTGVWLSHSEMTPKHYYRIIGWVLGGIVVMYGFIVLRDLHPGVTVEWALGTQAIALTIGSIGGLLIGIQETKAIVRTEQLETYTQELRESEQTLERQNEQLEQFASVLSHDLRNPLNVAQGNLALAQDEYESDRLDTIEDAHERIEALITDLLLAQNGDSISETESVDLQSLVESCWQTVATADATLSVEQMQPAMADRDRLRQLLENLMRNAIDHGGTGVTLTVGELTSGFYVADDGSGIPDAEQAQVFESGYTTSQDGTGFGLAIVKEIADAHGWEIRVTDGTDGGARFEITGVDFDT